MDKSIVSFNSASALLSAIPANVMPLLKLVEAENKSKDGTRTTSRSGSFALMTFATYAASQGLVKPDKSEPKGSLKRETWKACQRRYDAQKPEAAAFVKRCLAEAIADNKLAGQSIRMSESISKNGNVRRRVAAVMQDPSVKKAAGKKLASVEDVRAAAAALGFQLVMPELA